MFTHRFIAVSLYSLLVATLGTGIAASGQASTPGATATAPGQGPDLILYNGKVFTSDPSLPKAEAVGIRGERIVAVGSNADVKRTSDGHTKLIDLHGRTVIPGLNDAHAHLSIDPHDEVSIETESYNPTWQELSNSIRSAVAKSGKGTFISGTFGTAVFYDPAIDRSALDKVAPNHSLLLLSFDGHAAILNSAALGKFGIDESIADPIGGRFERGPDGKLTGVIREYAFDKVLDRLAKMTSDQDATTSLRNQLERAARYGITSIQDMPLGVSVDRTQRLLAQMPTPIRVRITRMNMPTSQGLDYKTDSAVSEHPAPRVTVNGTKWVLDGVVYEGSLTPRANAAKLAASGGPYSFAGLPPLFEKHSIQEMLQDALRNNYQLQFHVAGTLAATELFEAMEQTGGARTWAGRRLRVEHGDGLTPNLVLKAKSLGVVVSQQGSHLDILGVDSGLGPGFLDRLRAEHSEPLRSLLTAGIPLALGSDGPLNPWLSVLGATTDPDRPEEALTREQAVIAYTSGSAYAEFEENDKGTITVGKLADIAVLSQDVFAVPPPDLPKTRSVLTMVGGRIVYDSHALDTQQQRGSPPQLEKDTKPL